MNTKKIVCPHCTARLEIGEYYLDVEFNLLCVFCEKVVFPTTQEKENQITKTGKTKSYPYNYENQQYGWE